MLKFWQLNKAAIRKGLIILVCIVAFVLLVAGVQFCHQVKQIEKKVGGKIDQVMSPPIVIVEKYDSATQVRIITIKVDQKISHGRIDSLSGAQLQFTLDSVFNRPRIR